MVHQHHVMHSNTWRNTSAKRFWCYSTPTFFCISWVPAAGDLSCEKRRRNINCNTLVQVLSNSVFHFFIVYGVLSVFNGMTKLENTRRVVFLTATAAILNLSAKTAEVSTKLMHDVETNPGPNCSGVSNFVISATKIII